MLSFTLLGPLSILKNGEPLDQFRSQKEAALLIYLAHTGQLHSREFLADLLWESSSTKQALSNLRTVLARLRKSIGDALVVTRKTISFDTDQFESADSALLLESLENTSEIRSIQDAEHMLNVLERSNGEFLENFYLLSAEKFNEWILMTREQIRRQKLFAYEKLGNFATAHQNIDLGLRVARQWLESDQLDESAHMLMIKFLIEAGNTRQALEQYSHAVTLLRSELGIEPPREMTELVQEIQPKQYQAEQSRPISKSVRNNLPTPYDAFFGRESTLKAINNRLDQPWCRLVTIVGQGGVGKTRLSTTVGRNRLPHYPDGVWFIELANIPPDDEDIDEAIAVEIATVLDLRLTGSGTPANQILDFLQYKETLLILDNIEHLLPYGVDLVLEITQRCESVQLLITSRERLKVRPEWVISLSGLAYPQNVDEELPCEAVDLFVSRHQQEYHGEITVENMTAIREICQRVEGLPLAIELAAALTHTVSPKAIAAELAKGFDTLETSYRDVPERHRSMFIVFEMSWSTLNSDQQQTLARLSLFQGSFTADAARQITGAKSNQLAALSDKSLLRFLSGIDRYTLHPIVKAHAAERIFPNDPTLTHHSDYYLELLESQSNSLETDTPQFAMSVLEPDIENIRLAWQTGVTNGSFNLLQAALKPISIYFQLRGLAYDAEAFMERTIKTALSHEAHGINLAIRAGLERGRFQNRLGRYRPAKQTLEHITTLAKDQGDEWAESMGSVWWAESLWRLGDYQQARKKLDFALTLAEKNEFTRIVGWCHHHLGIIGDIQSEHEKAHDHLQKASAAWRSLNHIRALSNTLNSIGLVYYHQGNLPAAQKALEEALNLCKQVDNRHLQSLMLNNLSMISTERGDFMGAQYFLRLGYHLVQLNGDLFTLGSIQINIGKNELLLGNPRAATESIEKGIRIFEQIGDLSMLPVGLIALAEAKQEVGAFDQSITFYEQALDIAKTNGYQNYACEALIGLAHVLSKVNHTQAKTFIKEAVILAEEINNHSLFEQAIKVDQSLATTK